MPRNPWLALDATTSPTVLARRLRRAWERFIDGERVGVVRTPVADSWRRSLQAGVDPSGSRLPPVVADDDEVAARWDAHPVARAAQGTREFLAAIADDAQHLVVVSDANGLLLSIEGDARLRRSAAASMNFTEGGLWDESSAGTNAIGTALAANHAIQIFAGEHFKEIAHAWTCSAAPIHDPDTGELLGAIDLISRLTTAHPHALATSAATAHVVETHLRCQLDERHARLRSRYRQRVLGGRRRALVTPSGNVIGEHPAGWLGATRLVPPPGGGELLLPSGAHAFAEPVGHDEAFIVHARDRTARRRPLLKLSLLGRDRARVQIGGRVVELGRRHSEILTLLWAHPAGWTSEGLAAELDGDAGRPGTARVHVHRLRKLLGPWIDTQPYRLSIDVACDATRVRSLLDRGAVKDAVYSYRGPLLPRSQAPGVVHERDALDCWLRHAVMTADDDEVLWAWVQSVSGREDLAAWKRLLSHLGFRDPRRSLAATQVASLRSSYA